MSGPRVAVIGAGYMGSNHARVIGESNHAELAVVVDIDLERARRVARLGDATASDTVEAALSCDAAIVATATEGHLETALTLIGAGIPLLIEKPLATNIEDVRLIIKAAEAADVPLTCGFVERFNPLLSTVRALMEEPPLHIVAVRHSPSAPRISNSVVFDLLIHDIDLAILLNGGDDVTRASGESWIDPDTGIAEIVDCSLRFTSGSIASLSASRASQRKLRSFQLSTRTTLLDLDLLRHDITVYRNLGQEQDDRLTYRAETIIDIPFVRHAGEPLALQFEHFLDLMAARVDVAWERQSLLSSHRVAADIERSTSGDGASEGAATEGAE